MKTVPLFALLSLIASGSVSAAIVYSGVENITIPLDLDNPDLEGIYINVFTGDVAMSFPATWSDAPWINLVQGGTAIYNSPLLQPVASVGSGYDPLDSGHYFVNLDPGATINSSSFFVGEETASQFHMGISGDTGKFVSASIGYLAFGYQTSGGGDTYFGWLRFTPSITGSGGVVDWAYESVTGVDLIVGAIPEPSAATVLAGAVGLGAVALRRRRRGA